MGSKSFKEKNTNGKELLNQDLLSNQDKPATLSKNAGLLRFCSTREVILAILGFICALLAGLSMPAFLIYFGRIIKDIGTASNTAESVKIVAGLGAFVVVFCFFAVVCFEYIADRMSEEFKCHFINSFLKQELAWHESQEGTEAVGVLEENAYAIRDGLGIKCGLAIQFLTMFIGGSVLGFLYSWKLTLVTLCGLPVLVFFALIILKSLGYQEKNSTSSINQATALADERFANIKTVASLGFEQASIKEYTDLMLKGEFYGIRSAMIFSFGLAGVLWTTLAINALGLWYGGVLVSDSLRDALSNLTGPIVPTDPSTYPDPDFTGAQAITVFLAILIGAFSLGQVGPNVGAILKSHTAAKKLCQIIDRQSAIDPTSSDGIDGASSVGDINFSKVTFAYPGRKDKYIFKDFDLHIPAGKTVAIVGSSGAGKSTILQLVQRLYDPESGVVTSNNRDIREYNLSSYRQQIGLVMQEPKLFATSIKNNIRMGATRNVSDEEIVEAAKCANADTFINAFPDKYDTDCGLQGSRLSGGQKQRIAIARAIIRRPSVLIFDEATSALDTQSEKVVQDAIDLLVETTKATTLIVAHRLSTIRNADIIVVLDTTPDGAKVVQKGSHDELMKDTGGVYYNLVESQVHNVETEVIGQDELSEAIVMRRMSHRTSSDLGTSTVVDQYENVTQAPVGGLKRVFKLSLAHCTSFFFIVCGAILAGMIFPFFGYVFAQFVNSYFIMDPDTLSSEINKWSLVMLGIAFLEGISEFIKYFAMNHLGWKLVNKLSVMLFKQTIHQNISFFEIPDNNPGSLCNILTADTVVVKDGFVTNTTAYIHATSAVATGTILAFLGSWRLALCLFALLVFLIPASVAQEALHFRKTDSGPDKTQAGSPAAILNEAGAGMRTICAFGLEKHFGKAFQDSLLKLRIQNMKAIILLGLSWGLSQGIQYILQAFSLWYGGKLVQDGDSTSSGVLQATFSLMFSVGNIGQIVSQTSGTAKFQASARRFFSLLDRQSEIDARDPSGLMLDRQAIKGKINVENIAFAYPSRPDSKIYKKLSFDIKAGETVAFVGQSGCGKSTIIQLLLRFYDLPGQRKINMEPKKETEDKAETAGIAELDIRGGGIKLDDTDIRDINLQSMRSNIALVAQESALFDMTVEENIRAGNPSATHEEIVEAAKAASAHDFITGFPDGYETKVGRGGCKVSGGQKQRIAIARALIRKPSILLLDEATSALDAASERAVQETIDSVVAEKSRTTLIVAQRLSTIKNADKIIVLENPSGRGTRVAEIGTHEQLMRIPDGVYRTLYELGGHVK